MIIYPPYIEGKIPAFTRNKGLRVPFTMNPAVAPIQVKGFRAVIKDLEETNEIAVLNQSVNLSMLVNNEVTFIEGLETANLIEGAYYKIQLAYVDSSVDDVTYSTVGIARFLERDPYLVLENIIPNSPTYRGIYNDGSNLIEEPEYYYSFTLTEVNTGKIISTTGQQIHSITNSYDNFYISQTLQLYGEYDLSYTVTTINGLELNTVKRIQVIPTLLPNLDVTINTYADRDNGTIEITLTPQSSISEEGLYILQRASNKDNYTKWEQIVTFTVKDQVDNFKWVDNTVEQGVFYQYSIVQFNTYGIYSDRLIGSLCQANFDGVFLSDANRQLYIKFNPKISSFKTNILENKTDTMGSKYPFFFRNGDGAYKEFPISGLISYYTDTNEMFVDKSKLGLDMQTETTNLVDYNVQAERIFKLEVLDWLNNGELKLFRSPTEGNYVVRLMSVSLSPEDQLGRMLHSFNCTAYEAASNDYESLAKHKLVKTDPMILSPETTQYASIPVINYSDQFSEEEEEIVITNSGERILRAEFRNFMPGDLIKYGKETIMIGATGSYVATQPAAAISIFSNLKGYSGIIHYEYVRSDSYFDKITNWQSGGVFACSIVPQEDEADLFALLDEYVKSYDSNMQITDYLSFTFSINSNSTPENTFFIWNGNVIDLAYTINQTYIINSQDINDKSTCTLGKGITVDVVVQLLKIETEETE